MILPLLKMQPDNWKTVSPRVLLFLCSFLSLHRIYFSINYPEQCCESIFPSHLIKSSARELHGIPRTRFTPHVLEILEEITPETSEKCTIHFSLAANNSIPSFKHGNGAWRKIIRHAFNGTLHPDRTLPGNVSLGFSATDRDLRYHPLKNMGCLSSSSPNGSLAFINFLEVKRQATRTEYPILPWKNRSRIPVFRGTPWGNFLKNFEGLKSYEVENFVLSRCHRCVAVSLSRKYPQLVDAKFHAARGDLFSNSRIKAAVKQWALPVDKIPSENYYTKYQVALVLCGIGAAFRTSVHLSTKTAILFQNCPWEEWFTKLMVPWKHYIPWDGGPGSLYTTLQWIQKKPSDVREIAENGHNFYLKFLSFESNEEHLYELLYRLSANISNFPAAEGAKL